MNEERATSALGAASGPAVRRGWGSVRLRVTLAVTLLFALAMAGGAWALVGAVERSLVNQVRTDDRSTLEMIGRSIASSPGERALVLSTDRPLQVELIQRGEVGVARGIGAPGQTTYWAIGETAGDLDAEVADGTVRTELEVETPVGDLVLVALTPVTIIDESVSTVRGALLLAVPSLVVLVGVMAWITTGRALRPVATMTRRVDEISGSTLHERVKVPSTDDEISDLARTMNAMLDRLEESATRQRRFVSDASHELRSPVAAIRTEMEVALLHPEGTDWEEVARNVLAEDERLGLIVADLLTLARSDEQSSARAGIAAAQAATPVGPVVAAEAARARRVPVEVTEWQGQPSPSPAVAGHVGDVPHVPHVASTSPGAAIEAVATAALPDAPPPTVGTTPVALSADELERVLRHLLDNAARHAASRVEVGISRAAVGVRITVDDDGPGVAPDDRQRIFERFGRLDAARARDAGGAGLGLAVVARLVGAAGGRVWVEDAPIGGARFSVDLPAA